MKQVINEANTKIAPKIAKAIVAILLISNENGVAGPASVLHSSNQLARWEAAFTDSQGAVLQADLGNGNQKIVSQSQRLVEPLGICLGQSGEYFVTDTGCASVVGVNPQTGEQRLVSSGGVLGMPFGITVEKKGTLLVANAANVVRVDPTTGGTSIVASGGLLQYPIAVAVGQDGTIYVVNALGAVVQVDPRSGQQTMVASGGYLERPQGIAVNGQNVYVTDVATPDGNFGIGRIIRIDTRTGEQTVVSEGGNLVGPIGIAVAPNGQIIVADPYTINPNSADLADGGFDGAILLVDDSSGEQTVLARGQQGVVNPRGVVVQAVQGAN